MNGKQSLSYKLTTFSLLLTVNHFRVVANVMRVKTYRTLSDIIDFEKMNTSN